MTVKRKDDGELEEVKLGRFTVSYRTALLLLVLSATPMGEPIYSALGIKKPDAESNYRLAKLEKNMDEMHKGLEALSVGVQKIEYRLTGFQVDFDKYKNNETGTKNR